MCEEKKVFICTNDDGNASTGSTLKAAYERYVDEVDDDVRPEDLTFYEAVRIEVEVQFVKKEVVKKITPVGPSGPKPLKSK